MKRFIFLFAAMQLSVGAFAQSNEPLKGDVNEDGVVDVADTNAVIEIKKNDGGTGGQTTYYWYIGKDEELLGKDGTSYDLDLTKLPTVSSIEEIYRTWDVESIDNNLYVVCPTDWVGQFKLTDLNGFEIPQIDKTSQITSGVTGYSILRGTGKILDSKVVVVRAWTLNETSTMAPTATECAVDVTVNRSINANEWSTICLPFDMTAAQVKSAFGTGVQLRQLSSWSFTGEPTAAESFTLNFTPITTITRNVPCLIKVTDAISTFNVNGVVIYPAGSPTSTGVSYTVGSGTYNAYLCGSYTTTTVPDKALFLADNQLWYSKGSTNMKAFRGYFRFVDGEKNDVLLAAYNTGSSARVTMNFDNEATGINTIDYSPLTIDHYYDLQGRSVENPAKGIYLKNGKKVIIK